MRETRFDTPLALGYSTRAIYQNLRRNKRWDDSGGPRSGMLLYINKLPALWLSGCDDIGWYLVMCRCFNSVVSCMTGSCGNCLIVVPRVTGEYASEPDAVVSAAESATEVGRKPSRIDWGIQQRTNNTRCPNRGGPKPILLALYERCNAYDWWKLGLPLFEFA